MTRLSFDCRLRYPSGFELNLGFEAASGVTALFGPSGSGKSTTLALIAGLLRPRAGTIRLNERVLVDSSAGVFVPPEKRHVGLVFQDHLLFPHLTVRQNLQFGQRRSQMAAQRGLAISFDRVVQVLEIGSLLDRRPDAISGGQRQRVALGRALLSGPELLLMDEPLAALDENLKERILTYLQRVIEEWHIPTLFVSHDQADVHRLAEHVVIVEGGTAVAAGPTAEVFDAAVLTRMKRRTSPVNLLRVTNLCRVGEHWEGDASGQRLHLPGGAFQAGSNVFVQFQPHDVLLSGDNSPGLSARNRLAGTVREMVELPDRTFVAVDVGQFLWAQVTPEAARDLALAPGKRVVCIVKALALTVLEQDDAAKLVETSARKQLVAAPFPEAWYAFLNALFFYPALTPAEQAKLRDDLRIFMAEKDWEGCRGLTMNDEIKVTVAAQACLLTLGMSADSYRQVQTILVYPSGYLAPAFDRIGNVELEGETPMLGEAHYRGPVLLAWDEVLEGGRDPHAGRNLIFHEFAHQLDMLDGEANGAPPMADKLVPRWQRAMTREYRRLVAAAETGRPALLDKYGAENEAEFFAVATECFFTRPAALREEHADLYDVLREFYQQDPAQWRT